MTGYEDVTFPGDQPLVTPPVETYPSMNSRRDPSETPPLHRLQGKKQRNFTKLTALPTHHTLSRSALKEQPSHDET